MIANLFKAAVAVAITPVAVVADIVRLPVTAEDYRASAFGLTEQLLKNAAKNIHEATK